MLYSHSFILRTAGILAGLASIAVPLPAVADGGPWSSPVSVSDLGRANNHAVLQQGAGETWLAVWHSDAEEGGAADQTFNIFFARSTDNGETWSIPAPLNSNAAQQDSFDMRPHVATDRRGNWICVWQSNGVDPDEFHIAYSRSNDDGASWTDAQVLSRDIQTRGFDWEENPRIAFAGRDTWVIVWEDGDGEVTGNSRIFMTRSTDGGESWEDARFMSEDAAAANISPTIASSGLGVFTVAWSNGVLENDEFSGWNVRYSRSNDAGETWSDPAPIMTPPEQNDAGESAGWDARDPHLAADGGGRWIVTWKAEAPLSLDMPIRYSVSKDNGRTWNAHGVLANPDGENSRPALAADGSGNWLALWSNLDPERPAENTLLMYAHGGKGGTEWGEPDFVHPAGGGETVSEINPTVATDSQGAWLAGWTIDDRVSAAPLVTSRARFTGVIEGTVVDLSEREAVEGAVALLYRDGDLPERAAPADNDGVFRFPNAPEGAYTVEVRAPSYETASEDGDAAAGMTSGHDVVLLSTEPERAISGILTDEETGQPLAGVRVRRIENGETLDVTYTNAKGRYLLPLPSRLELPGDTAGVVYEGKGYETITREVELPEEGETGEDVELPPTFVSPDLFGTVYAEDTGEPIEDAEVELAGFGNVNVNTNSNGEYHLRHVPEGAYTVRANRVGYEAQTRTAEAKGTHPHVLDFELPVDEDPEHHPADVNEDRRVDARDIQIVINDLLGLDINPDYDTDVLNNDTVDARDLQYVINVVLGIEN
ncbi:MAG: carboxypeptidase regulatory-like domain-containing protein [Candidatus Hydrogenedentota bacterium]